MFNYTCKVSPLHVPVYFPGVPDVVAETPRSPSVTKTNS